MKYQYENSYDNSVIEFIERVTHKLKTDTRGKLKKESLPENILKFKYIRSKTKKGMEVDFKESDFKQLIKWKSWKTMN